MIKKYCRTCRILDPRQNVCQLSGQPINPDTDYCTKHKDHIDICELCHRPTLDTYFVRDGENWHTFCGECVHKLNSCVFCKKSATCDFDTNPSSLPKMVQQQIRQGNMVSVMTVKNPERIRQTCEKGCDCFSPELGCMREFNYCERMDYVYEEHFERTDSGAIEDSGDSPELHCEVHESGEEGGSN